ncbi:uncharacterized protein TNCV_3803051 [Trichonephila clavipes]|nr:uncharacterized protein TNCV_3803051 [Trichonephila clavipes]
MPNLWRLCDETRSVERSPRHGRPRAKMANEDKYLTNEAHYMRAFGDGPRNVEPWSKSIGIAAEIHERPFCLVRSPNSLIRRPFIWREPETRPEKSEKEISMVDANGLVRHRTGRPLLERMTTALQRGDVDLLQDLVLEGHGKHLVGKTSWHDEVKNFLKELPTYLNTIQSFHDAIRKGDVDKVREHVSSNEKLMKARDDMGSLPLHIAASTDPSDVLDYLIKNFPNVVNAKDAMGKTVLHIASQKGNLDLCRQLKQVGADPKILDQKGRTADFYLQNSKTESSPMKQNSNFSKVSPNTSSDSMFSSSSKEDMSKSNDITNKRKAFYRKNSRKVSTDITVITENNEKTVQELVSAEPNTSDHEEENDASNNQDDSATTSNELDGADDKDKNTESRESINEGETEEKLLPENEEETEKMETEEETNLNEDNTVEETENETEIDTVNEASEEPTDSPDSDKEEVNEEEKQQPTENNSDTEDVTTEEPENISKNIEEIITDEPDENPDPNTSNAVDDTEDELIIDQPEPEENQEATNANLEENEPEKEEGNDSSELEDEEKGDANTEYDSEVKENSEEVATEEDTLDDKPTEINDETNEESSKDLDVVEKSPSQSEDSNAAVIEAADDPQTQETVPDTKESTDSDKEEEDVPDETDNLTNDNTNDTLNKMQQNSEGKTVAEVGSGNVENLENADVNEEPSTEHLPNSEAVKDEENELKEIEVDKEEKNTTDIKDTEEEAKPNTESEEQIDSTEIEETNAEDEENKKNDDAEGTIESESGGEKPTDLNNPTNKEDEEEKKEDEDHEIKNDDTGPEAGEGGEESKEVEHQEDTANKNEDNEEKNDPTTESSENNEENKDNNSGDTSHQTKDHLDELIEHWIKEGDLLRLEHVVLAGQGDRLIERTSDDKQVQDFLDLVPIYMVAAVAEWYRYRIVACLVTSSSPVPLKTRRVGQRCTLNLSRTKTSSRWCGVVVRRGGASSGVVHVT